MQTAFYFDQTRCIGCSTCAVACKDWHDIPAGPVHLIRVSKIERGRFPQVFRTFLATPCYHCANPVCASVCPADAITKRQQDGIVVVDREACLGSSCGLCLEECPHGSPQFGPENDAKLQKCDFCLERWQEGKKPVCVMACPVEALDAGNLEELKQKYAGAKEEATGFIGPAKTKPSVVFRSKPWGG
jgi:anaerobic dimethyl sulfoxide reductase subunit B